ncbi:CAP domain-containing protein [Sphaerimonospora cavernae]|uniref:CAP domain-containing protein n=1 Tax=Sphaerimonospora cavernae TaxID=1740611 RepID=A0ABV6U990_9ACTN
MGLLACSTAILLIGVVIGRATSPGEDIDDVYLRNQAPSPTPVESAPAAPSRDRPPLDHVLRTDVPRTGQVPKPSPAPRSRPRRPANVIDGSNGESPLWSTLGRENTGGTTDGGVGPDAFPSLERQVVRLVNAERARRGCAPLRLDRRLVRSARAHSAEMAAANHFDHSSPDGATPWDRMAAAGYTNSGAEIIARGYQTAQEVVRGWMADRQDRTTILNCRLVATGVGVNMGPGGPWWTEDFGYS